MKKRVFLVPSTATNLKNYLGHFVSPEEPLRLCHPLKILSINHSPLPHPSLHPTEFSTVLPFSVFFRDSLIILP